MGTGSFFFLKVLPGFIVTITGIDMHGLAVA
jgi:hypothetical protein